MCLYLLYSEEEIELFTSISTATAQHPCIILHVLLGLVGPLQF